MSYTCPVCNKDLAFVGSGDLTNVRCRHIINKYVAFVHDNGYVNVYSVGKAGYPSSFLLTLKCPKRLDEEYIYKMMLLK